MAKDPPLTSTAGHTPRSPCHPLIVATSHAGTISETMGSCRPAMALNTSLYPSDDEARAVIEATAAETGLPADDPVRFGADRLWPSVRDAVERLPWV